MHRKLTGEEMVIDAVEQMRSHCRLQMEINDHTPISARGVLYTLGFRVEEADEVIEALMREGFSYCLDPMIPTKDVETGEFRATPEFACYWGPDQLLSRLDFCWKLQRGR